MGSGIARWLAPAPQAATVTVLFHDVAAIERALERLYDAGIPRDLIEVVVSRDAAQQFYGARGPGAPRAPGRETWRYAGIGGLIGFLGGVGLSLMMVAWPGLDAPGGLALVQLAGPNFGTVAGAAVGAIVGASRRQRPLPRHARAAEASQAIVLAVQARDEREAGLLLSLLHAQGGAAPRVERIPIRR